ncbi:MAG: flavodoxin-dependent (E)-4-hydroxy-3-methylbut-2-enyl-diphosphate synthase [Nitrospinae bacterium]|nr:flavodoxin-dependent (E)-4-hydroxy-3-methylbut-2-enyl-diphosphate synthase [Nitrospinota bacterium]
MRTKSRQIEVGGVPIGGGAQIVVQSMTKTKTEDVEATLTQISQLAAEGCEIVRVAVPHKKAASALADIVADSSLPVIADIHFNYRLALKALEAGIHGLRLNPGNIGEPWKVKEVVQAALAADVPIRIGVNAGSLEADLKEKFRGDVPRAMVDSALRQIRLLEDLGFDAIKLSLKASDVPTTVAAYRRMAEVCDYPLHLGITEAGSLFSGTIKSSVGLGIILSEGIGDTIRVSLAGDAVEEVRVGYEILGALGLRHRGVTIVACPTCGRLEFDMLSLVARIEREIAPLETPIKVAIMGCVVNGPGESEKADVGLAAGNGYGLLYRKGKIVGKIKEHEYYDRLLDAIHAAAAEVDQS